MQCGVSTACLYPMETKQSLQSLQQLGIETVEIFFNTFQELEEPYVTSLQRALSRAKTRVTAFHPFTSGMETFFFASMYPTRCEDGLSLYSRYFEICRQLNIPRVVFHGDYAQTDFPFAQHCENYLRLREAARTYGVEFCQENVVRCKCGHPDYIREMRKVTRDDVSFVLDLKQARRAEVSLTEMMDAMRGKISHLHLSDALPDHDCVLPGTGDTDFKAIFTTLQKQGFCGDMNIELYRDGFGVPEDLKHAAVWLGNLFLDTKQKNEKEHII